MRPGREKACGSCVIEREALWKGHETIRVLKDQRDAALEDDAYGRAKAIQKKMEDAYEHEMDRLLKTAQETKKRYMGYIDWMNKTGRS